MNQILSAIGIKDRPVALRCAMVEADLVLLILWGVGDAMIIFLAGMLDVPRQLYEAAEIEGASRWQKSRWVTCP